jgi:pimeloyl-ACP methyl ester carboxylesterase
LTTYVNDILNVIRYENLHDVILVGHSYGGMVISGVAEQVPERIRELVYLDAMVPNNGESAKDVLGNLWGSMKKDSRVMYPIGATKALPPSDVPQPLNTFTEPLKITNPLVEKIPTVFILMTKDGKSSPEFDKLGLVRAKAKKWKVYTFEGGHYSMREQPENLVKKLEEVTQQ